MKIENLDLRDILRRARGMVRGPERQVTTAHLILAALGHVESQGVKFLVSHSLNMERLAQGLHDMAVRAESDPAMQEKQSNDPTFSFEALLAIEHAAAAEDGMMELTLINECLHYRGANARLPLELAGIRVQDVQSYKEELMGAAAC